jgi:protein bicaudal D
MANASEKSTTNQFLLEQVCAERDRLRDEIERLKEELALTAKEKHQSAELGLQLLDEKEELQRRLDDVELQFEQTRVELSELTGAFNASQNQQKASAFSGIEQEESLLAESALKEATFASALTDIQRELKQVRVELERVEAEKERLLIENGDIGRQLEQVEWEKKGMRNELKELKCRETRLLSDMNELEEENIGLQKTVSGLRSGQVDFESAKHEVRRLQEELELRRSQVEEYETLRNIAEKQASFLF